jgi:hypothetical protein
VIAGQLMEELPLLEGPHTNLEYHPSTALGNLMPRIIPNWFDTASSAGGQQTNNTGA